eukprot:Lankesteria_metandrocarpae@DN5042_c0_g2_i3.p2
MTESMGKWCAEKGQLEVVRQRVDDFAKERDWEKYHTPRNLVLAFVGEVGELAELFQWHDDSAGPFNVQTAFDTEQKKDHLRDELADCALYLIRLADRSVPFCMLYLFVLCRQLAHTAA